MKILVLRMGAIGDLLMSTPALRALIRRWPDAEITYVVGKGNRAVLEGLPYLSEVIEFDKSVHTTVRGFLALVRKLRAERFDLTLILQRSVKNVLIALAVGAKKTLTYRRDHSVQADGRMLHTVDNYLRTLAPLKLAGDDGRHLDFYIPEAARQSAAALLQESGIGESETLVLIVPGASTPARQWPYASLAALIERIALTHPDWRIALIGGPGDRASGDAALAQLQGDKRVPVLDFIGKTSLKETGALLLRADVLVTMDTGPMHLAAAVGTPLVALFGPTSPERTGPAPPPPTARKARAPLKLVHNEDLECVPCLSRTCARGDLACLARLSPERVLAAIEKQLL